MTSDASLLLDRPTPGVLRLRLNRPERRNALDASLVRALLTTVRECHDPVLVLGSSSSEAFCAGIDRTVAMADRARVSDALYELYEEMVASPSVIIAALDGHVIGGGAQLALASDIRVAGLDTAIRLAGPRHGLAVGAWGLASLVGRGRALDLCLSMREVRAAEALSIGLVDRVERDPEPAAAQLAAHIASLDAGAVRRSKELVRHGWASAAALALEREGNAGWDGSLEPSAVA